MNKKQKILLYIASIILVLLLLFPPYNFGERNRSKGHLFVLSKKSSSYRVSSVQLLAEMVGVTVIGLQLVLATKDRK